MPSIYNRAGKRKGNRKGYHLSWTTEFSSGEIPVQVERKVKSVEEYEIIRFQGIREWALPSLRVLCYWKKILATSFSSPALSFSFLYLLNWMNGNLRSYWNKITHWSISFQSHVSWTWGALSSGTGTATAINNNFHLRKNFWFLSQLDYILTPIISFSWLKSLDFNFLPIPLPLQFGLSFSIYYVPPKSIYRNII